MEYSDGIAPHLVSSISIGRDGAMLPLLGGYREAMAGTLSLIGADRQVLHTIYLGDAPQYGKERFNGVMSREIALLKKRFGHLPWVGVADGAAHNWTFLCEHTDTQILDRGGGPLLPCLGIYIPSIEANICPQSYP